MNQKKWFVLFGSFDLSIFLLVIIRDLYEGIFPLYNQYISFSQSWISFFEGTVWSSFGWLGIIPTILIASTLISGVLLVKGNKFGLLLSLIHAPFRLLLISTPSFGVISYLYYQSGLPGAYFIFAIVYILEVLKTWMLIKLYKQS